MRSITRREFFHDSAALATALAGAGATSHFVRDSRTVHNRRKANGAAERDDEDELLIAVIGLNGRGKDHIKNFAGKHGCVVAALCDPDESVVGPAMKLAEKNQRRTPVYHRDLRRVLDDKSIHAVSIATPNHWHALAALWAMQAGKDVYVEKPVSHNVTEGRRLVEAARRYNRVCQAGTQARSYPAVRQAMEFLHAGKLGKVRLARGLCYKPRLPIGKVAGEQPIPKSIDYDLWCGPAPVKPLMRRRLHYDWHWLWEYGNGDLGNQGIHQMDLARWGLGKDELCKAVTSVGGRFGVADDGETANTQVCVFDYGDCELIFEVRGLPTAPLVKTKIGTIFYGAKGYLVCATYDHAVAFSPKGEVIHEFKGGHEGDHYANFVEAVRSRRPAALHAEALEGHLSSALCHLGNISYRLGRLQQFTKDAGSFGDDKQAKETLERVADHLKINHVALDDVNYHVGPRLAFDSASERFLNAPEADAYLRREYRKGFVVPEKL
jgi:predicted dehydrogenase